MNRPADPEPLDHAALTEILAEHERARTTRQGRRANRVRYRIEGFDFSKRDLDGVRFDDSVLIDCRFVGASLSGAVFSETQAPGCDFSGADLHKAEIFGAKLAGARFEGVRLLRASIIETDLQGACFATPTSPAP